MPELGPYGSGAARLAAIPAGESPADTRSPVHVVVISSGRAGDQSAGSLDVKALWGREAGSIRRRGASNLAGRNVSKPGSPEIRAPREADCGNFWECRAAQISAKAMSASKTWTLPMSELPGVIEDGMPGRNGQRKPGTARGSPRRSRTAKAFRISRHAAKSGRAREWGGWGRISDDGPGQNNPDPSEDPWGGGLPNLHGGALTRNRPDTARDYRLAKRCTKDGRKLSGKRRMPGAGLSRPASREGPI